MKKKDSIVFCIISVIALFTSTIGYAEEQRKKNVILIICDSMRADHLSAYGYKRKTSPNIDRLAKEGVLFTQAIAQGPGTLASIPSLITSTYPHIHGVVDLGQVIPPTLSTLSRVLKKEGYEALLISNQPLRAYLLNAVRAVVDFEAVKDYSGQEAAVVADEAIRYLEQKADEETPFFLWIYFFEPHLPYSPPPPYNKMYVEDKYYNRDRHIPIEKKALPFESKVKAFGKIPFEVAEDGITEVDYYIAKYDGAIRYVDSQIGRIIKTLKATGLYNNTLIVFSADHGEALGEHNYYFWHSWHLVYDELIKIPLIFYFPNSLGRNVKISTSVQSIDIAPTILEFLGIEPPESFKGKSLLPLLEGKRGKEAYTWFTISEGGPRIAIRTDKWKLIYNGGDTMDINSYELYNLKRDPLEADNLILREKEVFLDLRQYVISLKKEAKRYREKNKKEIEKYTKETIKRKVKEDKVPLSEDMKEMLRSLGYLQ